MSIKSAAAKVMRKAIEATLDKWLPGGTPDPILRKHGAIGTPVTRIDRSLKVTGAAPFAAEFPVAGMLLRCSCLQHNRQEPHYQPRHRCRQIEFHQIALRPTTGSIIRTSTRKKQLKNQISLRALSTPKTNTSR